MYSKEWLIEELIIMQKSELYDQIEEISKRMSKDEMDQIIQKAQETELGYKNITRQMIETYEHHELEYLVKAVNKKEVYLQRFLRIIFMLGLPLVVLIIVVEYLRLIGGI